MNQPPLSIDQALRQCGLTALQPGQRSLVEAILAGRDCLGATPSGADPSWGYLLSSLLRPSPTLVVSPRADWISAQIESLGLRGIAAREMGGSSASTAGEVDFQALLAGWPRLLYAQPRWLGDTDLLDRLRSLPLRLLVIDQAQRMCDSAVDDLPDYARIVPLRDRLGSVQVLAQTDDDSPAVHQRIIARLALDSAQVYVSCAAAFECQLETAACQTESWSASPVREMQPGEGVATSGGGPSPPGGLDGPQTAFLRRLLAASEAVHGRIGKHLLAQYLRGSATAKVRQLHLHRLSGFGLLPGARQGTAVALLDWLLQHQILQQHEISRNRPTIDVASKLSSPVVRQQALIRLPWPADLAESMAGWLQAGERASELGTATLATSGGASVSDGSPTTQPTAEAQPQVHEPTDWYATVTLFQANHDWTAVLRIRQLTDDQLSACLCEALRGGALIDRNWLAAADGDLRTPGQQRVLRELQRRASAGVQ